MGVLICAVLWLAFLLADDPFVVDIFAAMPDTEGGER